MSKGPVNEARAFDWYTISSKNTFVELKKDMLSLAIRSVSEARKQFIFNLYKGLSRLLKSSLSFFNILY